MIARRWMVGHFCCLGTFSAKRIAPIPAARDKPQKEAAHQVEQFAESSKHPDIFRGVF
jgi:hypothetical protein